VFLHFLFLRKITYSKKWGNSKDISGSDARTPGGMDQFHHDICGFAACLQAPPSGKGAAVTGLSFTEKVLILRGRKQAVADRHKGVPVRPAKSKHPEPRTVFHGAVVEDPCKQFRLFRTGAVITSFPVKSVVTSLIFFEAARAVFSVPY